MLSGADSCIQDNYIWAIHDGHCAAVVDPGEAGPVERFSAQHRLALGAIVITHHHGDHRAASRTCCRRIRSRPAAARCRSSGRPASASAAAPRRCAKATWWHWRRQRCSCACWTCPVTRLAMWPTWRMTPHLATAVRPCSAAIPCSPAAAAGCSRARRRRCWTRSTSWRHCRPPPASTVRMGTPPQCAFRAGGGAGQCGAGRLAGARAGSARAGRPTVPTTIGLERAVNPCARASRRCVRRSLPMGPPRQRCGGFRRTARLEGRLPLGPPAAIAPGASRVSTVARLCRGESH